MPHDSLWREVVGPSIHQWKVIRNPRNKLQCHHAHNHHAWQLLATSGTTCANFSLKHCRISTRNIVYKPVHIQPLPNWHYLDYYFHGIWYQLHSELRHYHWIGPASTAALLVRGVKHILQQSPSKHRAACRPLNRTVVHLPNIGMWPPQLQVHFLLIL